MTKIEILLQEIIDETYRGEPNPRLIRIAAEFIKELIISGGAD